MQSATSVDWAWYRAMYVDELRSDVFMYVCRLGKEKKRSVCLFVIDDRGANADAKCE